MALRRSPSVLPAENISRPIGSRKNAPTLHRRLHSPRPFVPPSESPQRNAQVQSELTKPDNRTTSENALMAIPTHGGIETQHPASRPVWRARVKQQA